MTPPLPLPLDLHPTPNSNPYLLGASIPDPECVLVTLPARPWAGGPPRTTSGCRGTRGSTGAAASRCRRASESGRARTAASRAWAPRTRACASAASTRAATRRARRRARARVQRGRRSCMPSSVILPRFIKSEFTPPPVLRLGQQDALAPPGSSVHVEPDARPLAADERAQIGEAAAHAAVPADAAGRLDEEQAALLPRAEAALARAGSGHVHDAVTRHVHGACDDRICRGGGARRAHAARQPGPTTARTGRERHRLDARDRCARSR